MTEENENKKRRMCDRDCPHFKEKWYITTRSRFFCDIDEKDVDPFRECRFKYLSFQGIRQLS